MTTSTISRPMENAALRSYRPAPLPPRDVVVDRLIVARATYDRYGARLFSNLLDRILEGAA